MVELRSGSGHDSSYDVRQVCLQPFSHEQVGCGILEWQQMSSVPYGMIREVENVQQDAPPLRLFPSESRGAKPFARWP